MGEKTKVVIDTNIIVSAFGWHGNPEKVLHLVSNGDIINFISFEMLNELKRVIAYPKIGFPKDLQAEILETIFTNSTEIEVKESVIIIDDDPDDNMVLSCAISAEVDFIISGDKHLLNLKKFKGIKILTPEEFLRGRITAV
ncbi:MAG: putative toxin-antitoxin system toxin component, PIN family [bacterium]